LKAEGSRRIKAASESRKNNGKWNTLVYKTKASRRKGFVKGEKVLKRTFVKTAQGER